MAPGYSKFNMYCQQPELGLETDSDHLVAEQGEAEVSDCESEVDRQAEYEGYFNKSSSPTKLE